MRHRLIALMALVAVSAPQLGGQSPRRMNFVSCPIVQDTPTVPCWLSEYEGEQYYLGIQTDISADFDPPYLGHQVLVEGVVSDEPRVCGGVVLKPVTVSPLPLARRPRRVTDPGHRPAPRRASRLAHLLDIMPPSPDRTEHSLVFPDVSYALTAGV